MLINGLLRVQQKQLLRILGHPIYSTKILILVYSHLGYEVAIKPHSRDFMRKRVFSLRSVF